MTDIQIISTYLPYVDVIAIDRFMYGIINKHELPAKFDTTVFHSGISGDQSLESLVDFLKDYLEKTEPINQPKISIFVAPDESIKEKSWEFFKELGVQSMHDYYGWIELHAFDDGDMPVYHDKRIGKDLPFSGFQDVKNIPCSKGEPVGSLLKKATESTRSHKFLFIDRYRDLPPNFIETLSRYIDEDKDRILDFDIHST